MEMLPRLRFPSEVKRNDAVARLAHECVSGEPYDRGQLAEQAREEASSDKEAYDPRGSELFACVSEIAKADECGGGGGLMTTIARRGLGGTPAAAGPSHTIGETRSG